jgi:hypothetical protein
MSAGYFVELAENNRRGREVLARHRLALTIVTLTRHAAGARIYDPGEKGGKLIIAAERSQEAGRLIRSARAVGYLSIPMDEQKVLICVKSVLGSSSSGEYPVSRTPAILSFNGLTIDLPGRSLLLKRRGPVPAVNHL